MSKELSEKLMDEISKEFAKDLLNNHGHGTMRMLAKACAATLAIKKAKSCHLSCDIKYRGRHYGHFSLVFKRTVKAKHKGE
jgi:hypothetical protein